MRIYVIGHLVKTNPIQTQSNPVLSAACPELAVALSVVEGVVEWVEWANCRKGEIDAKSVFTKDYEEKCG